VNVVHPNWFALAAAISSPWGLTICGVAVTLLFSLTWMGKISSAGGLLGVCVLLTLSMGAWFGCGPLRQDVFRQGLWPFTPFPIQDRATRLAAIRDPAKYKPAIVWSERAYSLWMGALKASLKTQRTCRWSMH
jgi:hypothetical protein